VTIWYTSDTHFGHANIIKYCDRPWATPEEMDEALIERWNSVVSPDDTVYHLGDVVMNMRNLWKVSRLNGTIILAAGNHDPCWDGFRKAPADALDRYLKAGFASIITSGIIYDHHLQDGRPVVLSHLPYVGNEHDARKFEGWRPEDKGLVNICGHVHEIWKVQGRSVNAGVDVWDWFPVPEEVLIDTIDRFVSSS
jgi:calcineurin-like phosphoesterase family protein